jgi:hypothetical protein
MAEKDQQSAQQGADVDYKAKYEDLHHACMVANGRKRALLTKIAKDVKALLKIICEPDPPGCSGPIPTENLADLLKQVQEANATKLADLSTISDEIDDLMLQICDPNPPGCV